MALSSTASYTSAYRVQSVQELLSDVTLDPSSTMVSQIYEVLRDLIVTMKLHPGQAISEKELAQFFRASKTPVREAMIRLEDANLVEIVPKSGTYVAPLNIDRYLSACFTRLSLEVGAVRAAAENPDRQKYADAYQDSLKQQRDAIEADNYALLFELDEKLHQLFFEAGNVPSVWATVQRTQADVYRVRHLRRLRNVKNGPRVVAQHVAIIDAILDGDADTAQSALVEHLGSLKAKIKSLAEQPELLKFIETLNTTPARKKRGRGSLPKNGQVMEEICQA